MHAVTPEVWGDKGIVVHSGIGGASTTVYGRVKDIVEAHAASGRSVLVTGHSLGAGVAALLCWLLRERWASHFNECGSTLTAPVCESASTVARHRGCKCCDATSAGQATTACMTAVTVLAWRSLRHVLLSTSTHHSSTPFLSNTRSCGWCSACLFEASGARSMFALYQSVHTRADSAAWLMRYFARVDSLLRMLLLGYLNIY
jgi:hypothetical protein